MNRERDKEMAGISPWSSWIFGGLLCLLVLTACSQVPAKMSDADYVDAMHSEHRGELPAPTPATLEPAGNGIAAGHVVYATDQGNAASGYLAVPADDPDAPGIVVIHEWWGLNDNIRAMARKLAGEGFKALAVDLYGGRAASDSGEARALVQAAMADPKGLSTNLRQANAYLREKMSAPAVATLGWCFGGGWSLRAALDAPGTVDAVVIYYGRLVTDEDRLAALDMPVLGHFGSLDRGIPLESVRSFEGIMQVLGKDVQVVVYDDADHAFANPSGSRYNAVAAEAAWRTTLQFLRRNLVEGAVHDHD